MYIVESIFRQNKLYHKRIYIRTIDVENLFTD